MGADADQHAVFRLDRAVPVGGVGGLLHLLGLVRGAIVLGVLVILCQLLHLDGERWWHESLLIPYVERVANGLRTLVGEQHHDIMRV